MSKVHISIQSIKNFLNIKGGIDDFLFYRYNSSDQLNMLFPVRINGFLAGICLKGSMEISIGLHRFRITPNELVIILPCYIIQIHEKSEDLDFEMIVISNNLMDAIKLTTDKVLNPYVYIDEKPVVMIENEESKKLILTMYDSLHNLIRFYNLPYYRKMIQHYVYAFLFGVGYIFEQLNPKINIPKSLDNSLLKRFFFLLQKHFKEEHSVAFYANELCLTPKYLSFYIKKTSGRTPSEWIQEIIILEAKVLLHGNEISIQEITEELHFSDQTTFGKFFKKHVGLTPKQYQNRI